MKNFGSTSGLTILAEDQATPANGMVNYITSSYQSGWQNGDIKGAFLSDTDDTDLVGSGEIWSGTPDRIDANWTDNLDGTYTSDGSTGFIGFASPKPLIAGETYVSELTVDSITSGSVSLPYDGTGAVLKTSVGTFVGTFVADAGGDTNGAYVYSNNFAGTVSNISVKLADADRSVNNKGLIVNGTITRSPVADGAELVAYSGFSASNYLEQPYNADLDFGTGDFAVMGWFRQSSSALATIFDRYAIGRSGAGFEVRFDTNGRLFVFTSNATGQASYVYGASGSFSFGSHSFFAVVRRSGALELYVNGVRVAEQSSVTPTAARDISVPAPMRIGSRVDGALPFNGDLSLLRITGTPPSADQIARIYNDERALFEPGAACTLYGASDAVTALAHDPDTDLLHVGTSDGRSVFRGLERIQNTTTSVSKAISASGGLVAEK